MQPEICKPAQTDVILDITSMGKKNSPQVRSAVLQLITTLLGIWLRLSIDDIFMERMSGAMTNSVFCVNVHQGSVTKLAPKEPSKLLLRIYGQGIDWMFSRRRELQCTQRLAEVGIAPKWLGIFGNGRFEEFVRNTPITSEMVRDPAISAKVARKLFHLHYRGSQQVSKDVDTDEGQKSILWKRLTAWRANAIEALVVLGESEKHQNSPYLEKIIQMGLADADFDEELQEQKDECKGISSPIVLCHNDLHQGNMMLRKEDNSVILIDFEYAAMSPRGFDLANHFCEWASDYTGETPESLDFAHKFPTAEQQLGFIQAYCEEAARHGEECEAEMLYLETQRFTPISHLLWGHWAIIQASKSYIEFDYLRYAYERLVEYQRTRTA